ncbi:hypothetical protein, partial [Streptomyces tsukubensis]
AAYLPLDGRLPVDRLAFMLADSGARLVLGVQESLGDVPVGRVSLVALDDAVTSALVAAEPEGLPDVVVGGLGLAYV